MNTEEQIQDYMKQLTDPTIYVNLLSKEIGLYDNKELTKLELLENIIAIHRAQMRIYNNELLQSLFGDKDVNRSSSTE